MDLHELHAAVLNLARELDRTPTKQELYANIKGGQVALQKFYERRYTDLLRAVGLELNPHTTGRVTNEIFKKNIVEQVNGHQPKDIQRSKQYPKILILGDLHFPFVHKKALEAAHEFAKIEQPDYIVQIGDIFDMYAHSKFPRSQNIYSPLEEENLAKTMANKMWKRFKDECPKAKSIQILGNHDLRPVKRVMESMPQIEHWAEKYFKELMTFENVETIFDAREEYKIEDIVFIHGFGSRIGQHRDHVMANVVNGHTHTGHTSFRQMNDKILWELNVGYLADQYSKGLSYTPTKTVRWTLGFGFIDKNGCRFIPY